MAGKPIFVLCVCTGECPGFKDINIWGLVNRVRSELPVDFAIAHPQLCEEDGDRFLKSFLRPDRNYVIAGCGESMQRKLFRDAFVEAKVPQEKHVGVDIRMKSTDEAFQLISSAVDKASKS